LGKEVTPTQLPPDRLAGVAKPFAQRLIDLAMDSVPNLLCTERLVVPSTQT
jgi:hypothetical protein